MSFLVCLLPSMLCNIDLTHYDGYTWNTKNANIGVDNVIVKCHITRDLKTISSLTRKLYRHCSNIVHKNEETTPNIQITYSICDTGQIITLTQHDAPARSSTIWADNLSWHNKPIIFPFYAIKRTNMIHCLRPYPAVLVFTRFMVACTERYICFLYCVSDSYYSVISNSSLGY